MIFPMPDDKLNINYNSIQEEKSMLNMRGNTDGPSTSAHLFQFTLSTLGSNNRLIFLCYNFSSSHFLFYFYFTMETFPRSHPRIGPGGFFPGPTSREALAGISRPVATSEKGLARRGLTRL